MKDELKMNKDSVSLKEYFDNKFKELRDYIDIRFTSIDKATILAQESLDVRLESMNEFRNSMKDQTAQYITRTEHRSLLDKICIQIQALEKISDRQEGKASQKSVTYAYIIAVISMIISGVGLFIHSLIK
jgi:hypothetical protein